MALEQKLSLRLAQKLVMTPSLQQAIKLLQMTRLELEGVLTKELVENPVLEESEEYDEEEERAADANAERPESNEKQESPADGSTSEAEAEAAAPETPEETPETEAAESMDDIDLDAYFNDYLDGGEYQASSSFEEREAVPIENTLTREPDLYDHLMWQLQMSDLSNLQREICELIIGNLNKDGFLVATHEEIQLLGASPEEVSEFNSRLSRYDEAMDEAERTGGRAGARAGPAGRSRLLVVRGRPGRSLRSRTRSGRHRSPEPAREPDRAARGARRGGHPGLPHAGGAVGPAS